MDLHTTPVNYRLTKECVCAVMIEAKKRKKYSIYGIKHMECMCSCSIDSLGTYSSCFRINFYVSILDTKLHLFMNEKYFCLHRSSVS